MYCRAIIRCSGIVQGIGFRPFVYRLAVRKGLKGYVMNLGDAGVKIELEGERGKIEEFLIDLREKKPFLAKYEKISVSFFDETFGYKKFEIRESEKKERTGGISYIPPDLSICDKCREELFDKNNRRYLYPFIVCSECGPRFTVIEELPYDRERTSMRDFPMCEECKKEYNDPLDRRYHAEPTCCPRCGPKMFLYGNDGELIETKDAIREAACLIKEGYILAVKGIGGTHIACLTTDDDVVLELRKRRRRPFRPFAVMSRDLDTVRTFAYVSEKEEKLLKSYRRPIVVLKKNENYYLSEWVSPMLHTIGVMLPYSGIHELLLYYTKEPALIFTSGNYPSQPMAITNEEAIDQLKGIVDYFLLHNRRIVNRNDDSVVRIVDGRRTFLRRSRGWVPEPIKVFKGQSGRNIIAFGPDKNVTFTILSKGYAYLSQHIGDVENLEMLVYLRNAIKSMKKILNVGDDSISAVACDLHPSFLTTKEAEIFKELNSVELVKVQHHHAHVVSVMGEYGMDLEDSIVGIGIDGFGYGDDGNAWGGEVLLSSYSSYRRVGHLEEHPMPGGDLCAYYPVRMIAGILSTGLSEDENIEILKTYEKDFRYGMREIENILIQIKRGINTPKTTSMGRLLDAVSTALGICSRRTFEGEPAMKLESFAAKGDPKKVKIPIEIIRKGKSYVLKTFEILYEVIDSMKYHKKKDVAASAEEAIAKGIAEVAIMACQDRGIKKVALSGGVSYNDHISRVIRRTLEGEEITLYRNVKVPPGDGGVSFGQALVAFSKILER
ncbi:MAG: carbamoyltransferase HypF [Candidatus Asgardarchaeia archaeon]